MENLHEKNSNVREKKSVNSCIKKGAIGGIKIEAIFQTTNYGKRSKYL
jgi:hypothetical protein